MFNPVNDPPITCEVSNAANEIIEFTTEGGSVVPVAYVLSPQDDFGPTYPNRQLCFYTPPRCPTGFQLIRWSSFDIEEQSANLFGDVSCSDHVKMFLPINRVDEQLEDVGAELDRAGVLCGEQEIGNLEYAVNNNSRQAEVSGWSLFDFFFRSTS